MRRLRGEIHDPYLGRSCLTPERATRRGGRSEKSAEAVRAASVPAGMATRLLEAGRAASSEGPNGKKSETTVSLGSVRCQKSMQRKLPLEGKGEAGPLQRRGETPTAANGNERSEINQLMERVVEGGNGKAALKRVKQNKGSPGVDGRTVDERPTYLAENGEAIRAQLLDGTYQPKLVRRQEISKSGGGVRELGIPCVLDRLIQQAILQGCCNRCSTPPSRSTVTVSDLDATHMTPCVRRSGTCRKGNG